MKKTLIILSRIPYPLEKGDKLRAYHFIKELSKWEEIHLVAISDEPAQQSSINELKKYCKEIHVFPVSKWSIAVNMLKSFIMGLPFQSGYFYNSKVAKEISALIEKTKPDHIFLQLLRTTEYVKNIHGIDMTLDYMDAFAKGMERRFETAYFPASRIYKWEYFRLRKYEGRIYHWFKNKLIISEQDLNSLFITDTSEVKIIPNGVDTDFFSPRESKKKYDLLFFGNMSYPPNVSAAKYLCEEILPLLLKNYPDIKIAVSGAEPAKEVLALDGKNVEITGWIDDMREIIAQSKIVVAPMLIGTGLQNKLLQAMAMKIPCVTSTLANNALGAENKDSILVARTKEDYVRAIELLLQNPEVYQSIAESGHRFVNKNFNWEASARKVHELMYPEK
ncbi:MAG: glycosyltransferase [Bacteroidetes bacterium]|nr:glycosyltransferase [Bacteroidota bacterium]